MILMFVSLETLAIFHCFFEYFFHLKVAEVFLGVQTVIAHIQIVKNLDILGSEGLKMVMKC